MNENMVDPAHILKIRFIVVSSGLVVRTLEEIHFLGQQGLGMLKDGLANPTENYALLIESPGAHRPKRAADGGRDLNKARRTDLTIFMN